MLAVWAFIQERNAGLMRSGLPESWLPSPTMRHARWWWRVHQAVPELPPERDRTEFVGYFGEILYLAEFSKDVLNSPMDVSNVWAYFAYRPWESTKNDELYQRACEEGRITPLQALTIESDRTSGLIKKIDNNFAVTKVL